MPAGRREPGAACPLSARPPAGRPAGAAAAARRDRVQSEIAGLRLVTAAAEADTYVEDVSTLVSRIGDVADWDVLLMCVSMDDRVLVVGRSRTSAVAIDRLLEPWWRRTRPGRVRHRSRAGPRDVLGRAIAEVERVAQPPLRAGDVMSHPVHAVSSGDDISARCSSSASGSASAASRSPTMVI